MKSTIFIPKIIKVGFQKREGTYTGKLAYIIYYDEKGKLRKENSWNKWVDKNIETIELENLPTSGFVLNKKVGGYSSGWNHRQTYCRVHDERNFEFEISVLNLLYILENTNSIKGKGLDGEFVYGWDRDELILIPTSSPDYVEISQFTKILQEKNYIKSKDLIIGATYRTKDNEEWIYMGRYDYYGYRGDNEGKKYYFYKKGKYYSHFETRKSLGDKIIGVISEDCVENYADLIDKLERDYHYSPIDDSKDEYVYYDFETFENKVNSYGWGTAVYTNESNYNLIKIRKSNEPNNFVVYVEGTDYWRRENKLFEGTLMEIYKHYKPMYKNKYLANGKLYQKGE
ncbi:hypothetical protein [Paenibacillus oleatilyticus]|uniref:hypothetical protein n=1 Tax=Paenibacillus oleatilyticus TaxID=2594886 RepID=UPI001C1F7E11|nr:hypothetical protein [Paenibacillus oleatilyticus]MBU7315986.1 hypothetical protein [Paenibacillus oleatilyticus]